MVKRNINGVLKILTNNIVNGILSLNDDTLKWLQEKHFQAKPACEEIFVTDYPPIIQLVIFKEIDEEIFKRAADQTMVKTKDGSGPSGLDVDGWKKILNNKYIW